MKHDLLFTDAEYTLWVKALSVIVPLGEMGKWRLKSGQPLEEGSQPAVTGSLADVSS